MRRGEVSIAFTCEDVQAGQVSDPYLRPPNHISSIRERRSRLAEYNVVNGADSAPWEMYDLG